MVPAVDGKEICQSAGATALSSFEQRKGIGSASLARDIGGRSAVIEPTVAMRTVIEQRLEQCDIIVCSRFVQWHHTALLRGVGVSAACEQQSHDGRCSHCYRAVQRTHRHRIA